MLGRYVSCSIDSVSNEVEFYGKTSSTSEYRLLAYKNITNQDYVYTKTR